MQIKNVMPHAATTAISIPGKPSYNLVMEVDANQLIKEKDSERGKNYFSLLKGTFAYVFDDPSRKDNYILVKYGKNKGKIMRICDFMIHIVVWRANVLFDIPIEENDFYCLSNPSNKMFNAILDKVAEKLIEHEDDVTPAICECMANIKEDLSEIAEAYSSVRCNTVSLWNIIQFKNRNPKFNKLVHTVLDKSKPIKELEIEMKQCEKDLIDVIKTDNINCFAPYLRSGRIKSGQLTKVLCAVGTRPDIDKTILPWPVKTGYIHGLQDAPEYFMETITARDAMLTKNNNVPRSGFLSRQINRLTGSVHINYKVQDCGTKNYLKYTIENKDYLTMAEGKYYLDEKSGQLKILTRKDTDLIGKTIKMRSMIGCCCKDGVCRTCAGKISIRLRGTRVGTLPSIKSINPLSQKAMSAKHDTGTKSIAITNEALAKYFYSDGTDFFLKPEYASRKNMYIVIKEDDVEEILNASNFDVDDDSVDTRVQLSYVAVRDNGVDYVIENEGMRVALSDDTVSAKSSYVDDPDDTDYILIPLWKLESEAPVFSIILDTEEISKYLNAFIGTVDRISIKRFESYDDLMAEMNRIIYESGFINKIIHFESIVYSMIRDVNDSTIRPDFSIENVPYQILKVSSAIETKDMYTTVSFQGLRRLFKDLSIRRRYGQSLYDPFFRISGLY